MSDLREIAEKRVDRKNKFHKNLREYIIVNFVLVIVNFIFTPDFWWVLFPLIFWGIDVFIDFFKAYIFVDDFDSQNYRELKIQKEMEKLRN